MRYLFECRTIAFPTAFIQSSFSWCKKSIEQYKGHKSAMRWLSRFTQEEGKYTFVPVCNELDQYTCVYEPSSCKQDVKSTFTVSAMKNMLSSVVDSSKAWGLFKTSSAPFIDKHLLTCSNGIFNFFNSVDLSQKVRKQRVAFCLTKQGNDWERFFQKKLHIISALQD